MTRPTLLLVLFACLVFSNATFAQPVVPGFDVAVYASVTDPMKISFDSAGNLFAGRDNSGSGGGFGDAVKIHRIDSGGASFAEYGNTSIPDPDAVVVDIDGVFGTAGAVLMGGIISNATGGQIASVLPDQSVVGVFGPTTSFHNPSELLFDGLGRFLFTNHPNPATSVRGVFVSTGALDPPTLLFSVSANNAGMAVDPSDNIYVSTDDGRIEMHSFNGALIDANFVQNLGYAGAPLTVGQFDGGILALYTVTSLGELLEVDMLGNESVLGTGFVSVTDMAFGPDDALYVTEFDNDHVLRLPEPTGMLGPGIVFLCILVRRRHRRS